MRMLVRLWSGAGGWAGGGWPSFCWGGGDDGEEEGSAVLRVPAERRGGYSANMELASVA
jgi:hypothetical protein